ncbi:MAG: hypothetical protein HC871_12510 [Rhizobiales bacterium]|nr:hypothetical protein [Hyphomicrobiales bacterium]
MPPGFGFWGGFGELGLPTAALVSVVHMIDLLDHAKVDVNEYSFAQIVRTCDPVRQWEDNHWWLWRTGKGHPILSGARLVVADGFALCWRRQYSWQPADRSQGRPAREG